MTNMVISDFLAPIIVGIVLIVIGLIVEYRTDYFANRLNDFTQLNQENIPSRTRQGFFSTNWAEVTKQAKINLAAIYSIEPKNIFIVDWKIIRGFPFETRKLSLSFRIPTDKALELGIDDDFIDEPHLIALADRDGKIISTKSYWAGGITTTKITTYHFPEN